MTVKDRDWSKYVRAVAADLGVTSLTVTRYDAHRPKGFPAGATMLIGTFWVNICRDAGLVPNEAMDPELRFTQCVERVRSVADQLGVDTLLQGEYDAARPSGFPSTSAMRRTATWREICKAAGLRPRGASEDPRRRSEMLAEVRRIANEVGHPLSLEAYRAAAKGNPRAASRSALYKAFGDWSTVCGLAGIPRTVGVRKDARRWTYEQVLGWVRRCTDEHPDARLITIALYRAWSQTVDGAPSEFTIRQLAPDGLWSTAVRDARV